MQIARSPYLSFDGDTSIWSIALTNACNALRSIDPFAGDLLMKCTVCFVFLGGSFVVQLKVPTSIYVNQAREHDLRGTVFEAPHVSPAVAAMQHEFCITCSFPRGALMRTAF
jgi:hypothetical protein